MNDIQVWKREKLKQALCHCLAQLPPFKGSPHDKTCTGCFEFPDFGPKTYPLHFTGLDCLIFILTLLFVLPSSWLFYFSPQSSQLLAPNHGVAFWPLFLYYSFIMATGQIILEWSLCLVSWTGFFQAVLSQSWLSFGSTAKTDMVQNEQTVVKWVPSYSRERTMEKHIENNVYSFTVHMQGHRVCVLR